MWLFTKIGFFSVVQHKDDPELVVIRARVRDDLEKLNARIDPPLGEILEWKHADYRYRIHAAKADWVKVSCGLMADIDYTNFKDQVGGEWDRDDAYMSAWLAVRRLQGERLRYSERRSKG